MASQTVVIVTSSTSSTGGPSGGMQKEGLPSHKGSAHQQPTQRLQVSGKPSIPMWCNPFLQPMATNCYQHWLP